MCGYQGEMRGFGFGGDVRGYHGDVREGMRGYLEVCAGFEGRAVV